MSKAQDHGLSERDIEVFLSKQIAEAIELSWVWHNTTELDLRDELADRVLETMVSCYMLSMWQDAQVTSEDEVSESLGADFD